MKTSIEKETAIELYCAIRQAALSIDRALSAPAWALLLKFYDPTRRSWIAALIKRLTRADEASNEPLRYRRAPVRPGLLAKLAARIFGRAWRSVTISSEEEGFFRSLLLELMEILESGTYPGNERLVDLRLRLSECTSLLEHKCGSMPEIARCKMIEHFNQASHIRTLSIASILSAVEPPRSRRVQPT